MENLLYMRLLNKFSKNPLLREQALSENYYKTVLVQIRTHTRG